MKVLILSWYGRLGPSSRMRMWQFLPWLEREGIECTLAPLIGDDLLRERFRDGRYPLGGLLRSYARRIADLARSRRFDVIWIEKEALPWLPAGLELWLAGRAPLVIDYDDAVFHRYDLNARGWVRRLFGTRFGRVMTAAHAVTAGNGYLADRALSAGARRVQVIPTVVDLGRYSPKAPGSSGGKPVIVWIGTFSTAGYLKLLSGPLATLGGSREFRLRVIGGPVEPFPGVDMESIPWSEAREAAALGECDIGVMPLLDTPWERGKCGYKLIQYMACGLPVVASPVGANAEIVRDGENGLLAKTPEEWVEALDRLLGDAALRRRMGEAGRLRVEQEYCLERVAPRILGTLRSAAAGEPSPARARNGNLPVDATACAE